MIVALWLWYIPHVGILNLSPWSEVAHEDFGTKVALYLLVLPNLALNLFPPIPYLSESWSIGTEEYFDLIWPVLLRRVKRKRNRLALFVAIVAGYVLVNAALLQGGTMILPGGALETARHF